MNSVPTYLKYNSETGEFYRDLKNGNRKKIGWVSKSSGYVMFTSSSPKKTHIRLHRVAWEMMHGPVPEGMEIDHIDGIRSNNKADNLRLVSRKENNRNLGVRKGNKIGLAGVRWFHRTNKWQSFIGGNDGKTIWLGYFSSLIDAAAARISAQNKMNYTASHGRRVGW